MNTVLYAMAALCLVWPLIAVPRVARMRRRGQISDHNITLWRLMAACLLIFVPVMVIYFLFEFLPDQWGNFWEWLEKRYEPKPEAQSEAKTYRDDQP